MLENLPPYLYVVFGITTLATLLLFIWAIKNSAIDNIRKKSTLLFSILIIWLAIQAALSISNFYNADTNTLPPKIVLTGILPAIASIVLLFATSRGRQFIDSLPLKHLTYINTVRVPVELVLYWLYLNKSIPVLMTFEGRNFDILAGITAPVIAYFGFTKQVIGRKVIIGWNIVCLGLLLNIVVSAFFSAPSPLQQLAFDQPNIAILNFPFSWLPTFIVPIVLLVHLASLLQLLKPFNKSSGA